MNTTASILRAPLFAVLGAVLLSAGCSEPAATTEPLDRCAGVVCAASDACHLAGVCDGNTGACSNPSKGIVPTVDPLSFSAPQAGVVYAGDLVQLDAPAVTLGCGPVAAGDVTYRWAILAAPAGSSAVLTSTTAAAPAFVPDVAGGTFTLSLTVTDRLGNDAPPLFLDIEISACGGSAPVITQVASPQSRPAVGSTVRLSATAYDADQAAGGTCSPPRVDALQYQWRLLSAPLGSLVAITPSFSSDPGITFVADVAGLFAFEVTARDAAGLESPPMTVAVPTGACGPIVPAFAVSGGPIVVGNVVALTLSSPVTDVCIYSPVFAYSWSIVSRPAGSGAALAAATSASPSFIPDLPGRYEVELIVTDQAGFSTAARTTLDAAGCAAAPIAVITSRFVPPGGGVEATLFAGARVELSTLVTPGNCGAASTGPFAYSWTLLSKPSGSAAVLGPVDSANSSFVADLPNGEYQVAVTVTDGFGSQATAFQSVVVSPCGSQAPIATIANGSAATVAVNESLALSGTASVGSLICPARLDVTAALFSWALVSTPVGGTALWSSQSGSAVTFSPQLPSDGTSYRLSLTATSNFGVVGVPDFIDVTAVEQALTPSAITSLQVVAGGTVLFGPDPFFQGFPIQVAASPQEWMTGQVCGAGLSCSYAWSLVGLPAGSTASLNNAGIASPSFSPDRPGSYVLRVTVSSEGVRSVTFDGTLTVGACGGQSPVAAIANARASVNRGVVVQLDASGSSDPDAAPPCWLPQPLSYHWELSALPAGSASALNSTSAVNPSFTPDVVGDYQVRLTVSDGLHFSSVTSDMTALEVSALPFGGHFQAATVDDTGAPVFATYDPTTAGGRVQVWRCSANCDLAASATWAKVGPDVDTNVGVLTWVDGEEPRPVDVAVDFSGQIVVVYKTLTATTAGISSCGAAVATFSGGAWSRSDLALSLGGLTGCTAGGGAGDDLGRWLSLAVDPAGRITVGSTFRFGTSDYALLGYCGGGACGAGLPAGGMSFGWTVLDSAAFGNGIMGRFVQLLPSDGTRIRLAFQREAGVVTYQEWDSAGTSWITSALVLDANAGRYLRMGSASGNGVLAWYDPVNGQVRMTTCNGGTCNSSWTVDGGGGADVGRDLSMSITPTATRLAYWDATNDTLQLATAPTPAGPFVASPIAASPSSLSLVTTGTGFPLVAFTVGSSPNLWLAAP